MKTHTYTVQKGDAVRPQFVGTKVSIANAETVSEALASGHYENEAALVAAANAQRNIAVNRVVRKALSKDDASVSDAVTKGNAVKLGSPRPAATPATAKPATVKKNTAASSGNRLFEKCLADADFLRRMVSQGIVDETEFAAWQTARNAPPAEKKPKAAPATEGEAAQASTTQAPSTPARSAKPAGSRR